MGAIDALALAQNYGLDYQRHLFTQSIILDYFELSKRAIPKLAQLATKEGQLRLLQA